MASKATTLFSWAIGAKFMVLMVGFGSFQGSLFQLFLFITIEFLFFKQKTSLSNPKKNCYFYKFLVIYFVFLLLNGAPGRIWTHDTKVRSLVLFQLSYRSIEILLFFIKFFHSIFEIFSSISPSRSNLAFLFF